MRPIATLAAVWATLLCGLCPGQQVRPVSCDDSVVAADAMVRARELADGGNVPEALRVLQEVLEQEGDRLLPSPEEVDLYLPVRRLVNEALLHDATLLARYRESEGVRAAQMLARGEIALVERTRLLTPAGFEAALRLAQLELEAGRFESARLVLEQLERHPDRTGEGARDAAFLARVVSRYLDRAPVREWAARWEREASIPPADVEPIPAPALSVRGRTVIDPGAPVDPSTLPPLPLQSVPIGMGDTPEAEEAQRWAWAAPTCTGSVLYVADLVGVRALDATTLSVEWSASLASTLGGSGTRDQFPAMMSINTPGSSDPVWPAVADGVVVAHNAGGEIDPRRTPRTAYAFDARSGRLLWGVEPSALDERLGASTIRGPAGVGEGVAVLTLREQGLAVRVNRTHLVALDLYTGRPKWVRLLGSVGTNPWGRGTSRSDLTIIHEGVVYRGDEMGVLGAYEAATGRPRWVRLMGGVRTTELLTRWPAPAGSPPHEACAPVIVGDRLFYVEPGRGSVIELSAADGRLMARREGSDLGEPRYLLAAGSWLVCVGASRLAFVPVDDLARATAHQSPDYRPVGIAGRCVTAGTTVVVPLRGALAFVDPASPAADVRREVPATGNVLVVASGEAGPSHLVVADGRALHVYVRWERARDLLESRAKRSPGDPAPLLTYVELLHRAGQGASIPEVAERALALLQRDVLSESARAGRVRLYDLLLGVVRQGRSEGPVNHAATPAPTPVTDPAVLSRLLDIMGRCADTPEMTAAYLLERAWLARLQRRDRDAVEAYQAILADPVLAATPASGWSQADPALGVSATAGDEATWGLSEVLQLAGAAVYAGFDEEARIAADALPENAPAQVLMDLARRYPASEVSCGLWERAGRTLASEGRVRDARLAYGASLRCAELSAAMGRPGHVERIERALTNLLALDEDTPTGAVYRLCRDLAGRFPSLRVPGARGSRPIGDVVSELRVALDVPSPGPRVGVQASRGQVIERHDPLIPLFRRVRAAATDCIVMHAGGGGSDGTTALWGVDARDGLLRPLWTRRSQGPVPTVIQVTHDATVLHWAGSAGGWVEAISPEGRTLWRTPEFAEMAGENGISGERTPTPLDGQVRGDDLLVSSDGTTLALVQRGGRAGVIDLASGRVLWGGALPMTRVYEAAHAGGTLIVAGATRMGDGPSLRAVVVAIDPRTGEERSRLDPALIGDHPRWVREIPGGDAIVACAGGLVRYTPRGGKVVWSMPGAPGRGSIAGWVVGDALFVLDAELRLYRVSLADGSVAPDPLETRDRLTLPVEASVHDGLLTLACAQGMLTYDSSGHLVGADSLDSGRLQIVGITGEVTVALEVPGSGFDTPGGEIARLICFATRSGKILASERVRIYDVPTSALLVDGKIVIGQGVATIILNAPSGR
jgi:outer membrane protein assembly factor BamB